MTGEQAEADSPELREMAIEMRRLELERARDLDPVERKYRREQARALELANDAKARDGSKGSGISWTQVGFLVAWVATLVPVWISVHEYWDEREAAANEERRAAEAERKAALQDAIRRYSDGTVTAAFELPLYPEGVSFLVGQLQWGATGPRSEVEIEKTRAALIALQGVSGELTANQAERP